MRIRKNRTNLVECCSSRWRWLQWGSWCSRWDSSRTVGGRWIPSAGCAWWFHHVRSFHPPSWLPKMSFLYLMIVLLKTFHLEGFCSTWTLILIIPWSLTRHLRHETFLLLLPAPCSWPFVLSSRVRTHVALCLPQLASCQSHFIVECTIKVVLRSSYYQLELNC